MYTLHSGANLTPLQLSAEEQKAVLNAFKDPAAVQASGLRLAGNKFFTLQANERSIYLKKQVRQLFSCFKI